MSKHDGSSYIFDAFALLAFLEDEAGAELVARILGDSEMHIYLSIINLGEVFYIVHRRRGLDEAEKVTESIELENSLTVVDANWRRVKQAAKLKAGGGLSYADAFAVSLAQEHAAPLVTSDPEIIKQADKLGIAVIALDEEVV